MNNEMNNNLNNQGNPNGINYGTNGIPAGAAPMMPQQPVYPMPAQPPVAPAAPEMPMANNMTAPVTPQPVNPQPLEPSQVNFVASNNSTPGMPTPMPTPMNPQPMPATAPMPGSMPQTPMMNSQPMMGPMPGPMMPNGMPAQPAGVPNNNGTTPEGSKEKNPILMIILTVVVVLGVIVFLVLYLTGKINFGSKNPSSGTDVVENPTTKNELADWMNYLLEQETSEIKISRYIDADNTKSINLTKEQLESIFTKMKDYSLVKYYSTSKTVSNDDLQISYTKNDVTYNFTLSGENINIGDDSDFVALFTESDITIEDDGETSRDSENYNYILKNFDSSIYDEYFTGNEETKEEENADE